ncbi:MAG: tRNA preQ1(34) S-adenosylmethionine ribosyltransferase-isomerase QueA [Candidatus Eremiobacteraeota bacterium]|nr:tRNA preQ1(34) S-adenosylmethionine ribosyltransferase-isomerase QueA [Candidatus Eremiobacteraeota bacterium]
MTPSDPLATASYSYSLPQELIAQRPTERRDESRLLVLPRNGALSHHTFAQLPDLLRPGDLLVANDTKVIRARFAAKRRGGGAAEILLLRPLAQDGCWQALVRPGARIRVGDRLWFDGNTGVEIVDRAQGGLRVVRFVGMDAWAAMKCFGRVPLPPYIHDFPPDGETRYQTVYASRDGSAAAPTAGLHFTQRTLGDLERKGIEWTTITLHVGVGTFRPVQAAEVCGHVMHAERYELSAAAAEAIARAQTRGGRVVAVGTTTLRALEDSGGRPAARSTDLFIHPPQRVKMIDALITNFHLPRSTLLMLVCALAGTQRVLNAYAQAVSAGYRFFSFGDAMLVERWP